MRRALGTALLGTLLTVCAAAFATPSLYVAGLGLLFLALGSLAWVNAAAAGARLERHPGPARVIEGEAYPLRMEPRAGLVPPPGGELHDPLLDGPLPAAALRPGEVRVRVRLPWRGRYRLEESSWVIRDPLGLCSRRIRVELGTEVLVLPRIEPVAPPALAAAGPGSSSADGPEGARARAEPRAVDFEIDGVRPYREGSPASRIHWPTLARSGELYERRLAAGSESRPLVILDAEHPSGPEELDRAVRAAASLCVALARSGGCSLLLPGRRGPAEIDSGLRRWPPLHAALALIAAGVPTIVPARTARGSVFWVAAGAPARGQRVAAGLGPGPHYLVTPGGGGGAFSVAGCTATRLGAPARSAA